MIKKETSQKKRDPQKDGFKFSPENQIQVDAHMAKYPKGREASAILPLLHIAQQQNGGWLSVSALEEIAALLNMAYIRVYEVVTFYKMFYLAPPGKYNIQVCRTTPCWLRGAAQLTQTCQDKLQISPGMVTSDGLFGLTEVECMGACTHAPVVQINGDLFENLSPPMLDSIMTDLIEGKSLSTLYNEYTTPSSCPSSLKMQQDETTPPSKKSPRKTGVKKDAP